MRITLVIYSISCGGAERAAVLIAEGLSMQGHAVNLITFAEQSTDFYELSDGIERLVLNIAKKSPTFIHAAWNNIYRLWSLRRAICSTQPDAVVSFLPQTNVLTLIALSGTSYPIVVSEQNNPLKTHIYFSQSWDKLRRLMYPKANTVVSTSQGVDDYFDWLPQKKRVVIPNALTIFKIDSKPTELPQGLDPDRKWIVAMGRLTYQKGFDLLLQAFHQIARKFPDWQLSILGEGELRLELENMRQEFNLLEQVLLPGTVSNPFPILKQAKLFVMSSRFEGFGNVLIEAMSCGLPVISTDCPSGPREIIRDGVDGVLVPNEDIAALAKALEHLMLDERERQFLAANALEVKERFGLEKVTKMWESLLEQLN